MSLQKPIVWGKALEKVLLRDRVIGDLEGSLVCLLPFEEGFGVRVRDYSLFENHGTISGASWVDGKYGKALNFDGIDDYVNCGKKPSLYLGNTFSVEAWIKTSVYANAPSIIGRVDVGGAYIQYWYFGLLPSILPVGGIIEGVSDDGVNYSEICSTIIVADDVWHHVVWVRNEDTQKLYVDGIDRTRIIRIDLGIGDVNPPTDVIIGGDIESDDYYFDGLIDEVRIYNRALSAREIKRRFEERRSVYGV